MPSKIDPNDWDRLFAPNAPRRVGPLAVLIQIVVTVGVLGGIAYGGVTAVQYRNDQVATATAVMVAFNQTNGPLATATAEAEANERATIVAVPTLTAEARAAAPTVPPSLGRSTVTLGGNLRSEPILANETVIGLVAVGDTLEVLRERDVNGQRWFYVRILAIAPQREPNAVAVDTEGWVSATLVTEPAP
ncbi:MAG: SH3 domain-containing protein [Roseiflexaceae bacterium]